MDQKTKDQLKELWEITVGAVSVGAEKTKEVAGKLAARGKQEWEASAPKRAEIREKLEHCKEKFNDKIHEDKSDKVDFDAILNNLDKLSDEELEKLRTVLNKLG